jgi:hypothetical protein
MPVQVPAVQRRPPSILDPVGHHHQVGVQQRIPLPGCPLVEPHRQQPLSGHMLVSAVATASAQMSVQIGNRLGHPRMVGVQDRPAGRRIAQAIQDRRALGRPQHHVERRHRVATMRAAEELPSVGVAALEHPPEAHRRCFALQPQRGGAGAVPPAWGLTVAGQIRLVAGGEARGCSRPLDPPRASRCRPPPCRFPPRRRGRQQRTPGALLFSDDSGSSVERTATLHPLWRVACVPIRRQTRYICGGHGGRL